LFELCFNELIRHYN